MKFQEAIQQKKPILVDFFGSHCGACQTMAPILEILESEYRNEIQFLKINVEEHPMIAAAFQVRSVPALILFQQGKILWRKSGLVSKKELDVLLNSTNETPD